MNIIADIRHIESVDHIDIQEIYMIEDNEHVVIISNRIRDMTTEQISQMVINNTLDV